MKNLVIAIFYSFNNLDSELEPYYGILKVTFEGIIKV